MTATTRERAYFIEHDGPPPTIHDSVTGEVTQCFPAGSAVEYLPPNGAGYTIANIPGTGFFHWMPVYLLERQSQ